MRKLGTGLAALTLAFAGWDCSRWICQADEVPRAIQAITSDDHYPYYLLTETPKPADTDVSRSILDWSRVCGGGSAGCHIMPVPPIMYDSDEIVAEDAIAHDSIESTDEQPSDYASDYEAGNYGSEAGDYGSNYAAGDYGSEVGDYGSNYSTGSYTSDYEGGDYESIDEDAPLADEAKSGSLYNDYAYEAEDAYSEESIADDAPSAELTGSIYGDEYEDYNSEWSPEYAPTSSSITAGDENEYNEYIEPGYDSESDDSDSYVAENYDEEADFLRSQGAIGNDYEDQWQDRTAHPTDLPAYGDYSDSDESSSEDAEYSEYGSADYSDEVVSAEEEDAAGDVTAADRDEESGLYSDNWTPDESSPYQSDWLEDAEPAYTARRIDGPVATPAYQAPDDGEEFAPLYDDCEDESCEKYLNECGRNNATEANGRRDSNLADVVDAWPHIPASVKAVIMAMVKVSTSVR